MKTSLGAFPAWIYMMVCSWPILSTTLTSSICSRNSVDVSSQYLFRAAMAISASCILLIGDSFGFFLGEFKFVMIDPFYCLGYRYYTFCLIVVKLNYYHFSNDIIHLICLNFFLILMKNKYKLFALLLKK